MIPKAQPVIHDDEYFLSLSPKNRPKWNQKEALFLCKAIEEDCVENTGCHVALTGGVLCKDGPRKDLDILFYRVRQADVIDIKLLIENLKTKLNFKLLWGGAWCYKFEWQGRRIDVFFPEEHRVNDYHKPTEKFKDSDDPDAEGYPL